jgi:hypothetical protein
MTDRRSASRQIYTVKKPAKQLVVAVTPLRGFIFPTDIFLTAWLSFLLR